MLAERAHMDYLIINEGNETMRSLGSLHLSEKRRFLEGRTKHHREKQQGPDGPARNAQEATNPHRKSLERRRGDALERIGDKGYA